MPIGATLALRTEAGGFIGSFDGASLRSSVPHGHFAPLTVHRASFNRSLIPPLAAFVLALERGRAREGYGGL
jgi:hypothetical protein